MSQEESVNDTCIKRPDGKYEERFSEMWVAEYAEDPATSLWHVEIFKHDLSEWRSIDHTSLQEARQAARDFYDQI